MYMSIYVRPTLLNELYCYCWSVELMSSEDGYRLSLTFAFIHLSQFALQLVALFTVPSRTCYKVISFDTEKTRGLRSACGAVVSCHDSWIQSLCAS